MIAVVFGLIGGIGIDSALTLYAIHRIRLNQTALVQQALRELEEGIRYMAPAIVAELAKEHE